LRPRLATTTRVLALILLLQTGAAGQTQTFTMYTPEARRTLLVRPAIRK
jgi:hypothetical protein